MNPNQTTQPGVTPEARPDIVPPRTSQSVAAHPLVAAPVATALAGQAGVAAYAPRPTITSYETPALRSNNRSLWLIIGGVAVGLLVAGAAVWFLFGPKPSTPATVNPPSTAADSPAATNPANQVSTFNPQVGQTKTEVDVAAAADGRLPICTTSGEGTNKVDSCDYTATASSGKVRVTFVGSVVTAISR